jgi:hypothetical protein
MASSPLDSYPTRFDVAANPLLLDELLAPARALLDGYLREVRTEGVMTDPVFVRLGLLRILSQAISGREFLQQCGECGFRSKRTPIPILSGQDSGGSRTAFRSGPDSFSERSDALVRQVPRPGSSVKRAHRPFRRSAGARGSRGPEDRSPMGVAPLLTGAPSSGSRSAA